MNSTDTSSDLNLSDNTNYGPFNSTGLKDESKPNESAIAATTGIINQDKTEFDEDEEWLNSFMGAMSTSEESK